MLARSLETLSLRMNAACRNAEIIARFLAEHPRVARVYYAALLPPGDPARLVFERQCGAAGASFAFDVKGGERAAFQCLNALQVFKLAVSLGGTESLICHPASTTHSGVPKETRERIGLSDATIRLSIGIENAEDLVADLIQALAAIGP
jgi:methionine-gamma-lyase